LAGKVVEELAEADAVFAAGIGIATRLGASFR
jgi:hypothetical protein